MDIGRFVLVSALVVIAIGAGTYSLKAKFIRSYVLRATAKSYGEEGRVYRASKMFAENPVYLISYRFSAGVVAAVAIAMVIYIIL
jgi:hypothetical protein